MTGDDSRGRARARGRAPRCTRTSWMVGEDSRRARATVHKNTMIEDDARGRARARAGVTMHKHFKKSKSQNP